MSLTTADMFITANGLPRRWLNSKHSQQPFVIGATGFGSGLHFLATWQAFKHSSAQPNACQRLHFIAFEKYPLSLAEVAVAQRQWPALAPLSQQLRHQYPPLSPGCHRLCFEQGKVLLDIWLGDIRHCLAQLFQSQQGLMDAWYLDRFPAGDEIYHELQKLSKKDATGVHQRLDKPPLSIDPPFYYRHPTPTGSKQVAIIGGGIASAQLCYALAKRGFEITLYCKDPALAQGASQNRQGALYPLLQANDNALSEFYAAAYGYAIAQLKQLLSAGYEIEHQLCGVLMQAYDHKSTQKQQNLLDCGLWSDLFTPVDAAGASRLSGISSPHGGLFFPQGGWIKPRSLIDALIKAAGQLTPLKIKFNCPVNNIESISGHRWQVDHHASFDQLIIATGHHGNQFEQTKNLALSPIRGQVSHLASNSDIGKLKTVLCNSGYVTPALDNIHCIGASFIKNDSDTQLRQQEHINNLARFKTGFSQPSNHPAWLDELAVPSAGRAAIRCVSIDHLPLVGAVPNHSEYQQTYRDLWKGFKPSRYDLPPELPNLFILTALGARGLCTGPLAAEILAAQINNEVYPVSQRVLNALTPGRGLIKKLKARNGYFNV